MPGRSLAVKTTCLVLINIFKIVHYPSCFLIKGWDSHSRRANPSGKNESATIVNKRECGRGVKRADLGRVMGAAGPLFSWICFGIIVTCKHFLDSIVGCSCVVGMRQGSAPDGDLSVLDLVQMIIGVLYNANYVINRVDEYSRFEYFRVKNCNLHLFFQISISKTKILDS